MSGIRDRARAGELIRLLAVLASALTVPLPCDHHAARSLAPEVAGREVKVEHGQAVFDPLRVVLDAAGMKAHGTVGPADPVRGFLDLCGGHAGDLCGALRRPAVHRGAHVVKPRGMGVDVGRLGQAVPHDDVQHRQEEREIRARTNRQVEIGVARDRRHPRIDHNQPPAALAALPQVMSRDRCAFGGVRTGDEHDVGGNEIAPRVGRAVDAERELVRRAGRDHAEPPVVVDVLRAQRDAGELPDHVGLLRDHRRAAIDRDRVGAILVLDFEQARRGEIERRVV